MNIGLINVRSWKKGKFQDVTSEMGRNGLDILTVTQTNLRGKVTTNDGDYTFLGKGRENMSRAGGGVGIIYNNQRGFSIDEVEYGGEDDIAIYRVNALDNRDSIQCIIVVCYMTVEGPNIGENVAKYRILQDIADRFASEKVILVGDMNGHTGLLGEKTNRNGQMLLDFAEEAGMEILNHTIAEGKVTWQSNMLSSAIDYVLVNQEARMFIEELKVDEEGVFDIDSDHNALICEYGCDSNRMAGEYGSGCNDREKYIGRTDFMWAYKGRSFDDFEMDLAELDQLLGNNSAELNDNLVSKLGLVANKSFKKIKAKDRGKIKKIRDGGTMKYRKQ